jgi:hypothetical protein
VLSVNCDSPQEGEPDDIDTAFSVDNDRHFLGGKVHPPNPSCVVKVGDGRGFIVIHRVRVKLPPLKKHPQSVLERGEIFFSKHRVVVTAAHCLPCLPPAHAASDSFERTYKCLLGSLDGSKKEIWAECLFADPVADIAVLGCPNANLEDEYEAYGSLTDDAPFLRIGTAKSGPGWVLSIGGRWIRSRLEMFSGMGGESLMIDPTEPGMSGSPILNDAGLAVGMIALGTETVRESGERKNERSGPQPILVQNLPGWLLTRQAPR